VGWRLKERGTCQCVLLRCKAWHLVLVYWVPTLVVPVGACKNVNQLYIDLGNHLIIVPMASVDKAGP
jgi:hypothetical protein